MNAVPLNILTKKAAGGGYIARAQGHSIFTESDSMEALRKEVRDAVVCHFDEWQAPKVIRLYLVPAQSG